MFVCVAIMAIVLSVCASVLTYNEVNKVKFTCDVKGNKATYYVDFGDEKTMSLLYAHTVYAIKESDKVYKTYKENQRLYGNRLFYNDWQKRLDEKVIAREARKKEEANKNTHKDREVEVSHPSSFDRISPELKRQLYEKHAPKINWDSIIKADIANQQ